MSSPPPLPHSPTPPLSQKNGAVAAGHQKTAAAGIEMFRNGGNAFDAATAAMLASFVAEPMLTSAAGGGFLLAHTQDNCNILFDFFSQTPHQKKPIEQINFYPIDVNFGDAIQTFHIGLGSMAVPGNLLGAFHVHQKLGKLPLKEVAAPAIDYAKNGIELSEFQAYCLKLLEPIMTASPEARKVYAPNGKLLQAGELIIMPDFAATLTELVENGLAEFYQGEIARKLVQDCADRGGHLTIEDLKNYQVIERQPLMVKYRDRTLLTNPPPSSGGTLMAFAFELLSTLDFNKIDWGSKQHLEILAQVMALTNQARTDGYDAYIYQPDIAAKFLSLEHLAPYQQALTKTVNKWGSTTHISVCDREGNAASVTTSNGEGCGYVIPGTGIMMNNMLGEDDLNPSGFHNWPQNQRISSMMSPTIVLKDGKPEIVLGSGGSKRIRTAILQVISNLIDFKMPVTQAVASPRVHWENGIFHIEPGFEPEKLKNLTMPSSSQLVLWNQKNMFFGGVNAAIATSDTITGAGDPRRQGVVAIA